LLKKDELKVKFNEIEKSKHDTGKKHELQLTALNQNLANLRTELKLNNEKLNSAETNINLLKTANLGECPNNPLFDYN
jgi:hypothetical protein